MSQHWFLRGPCHKWSALDCRLSLERRKRGTISMFEFPPWTLSMIIFRMPWKLNTFGWPQQFISAAISWLWYLWSIKCLISNAFDNLPLINIITEIQTLKSVLHLYCSAHCLVSEGDDVTGSGSQPATFLYCSKNYWHVFRLYIYTSRMLGVQAYFRTMSQSP